MKTLLPEIDSPDKRFHAGNPATGEQGTRVTDTWLNDVQDHVRDVQAEAHYVLLKAGFKPVENQQTQLYDAIVKIIDDNRQKASTTGKGEVQLYSGYDSDSEEMAATPKAIKLLKAFIDALTRNLTNYIPNSKKSSDVNSASADTVATSAAVKKAYDKAESKWTAQAATETTAGILPISHKTDGTDKNKFASEYAVGEAAKKGVPIGAVVSFPRAVTNPVGFLRADGSTFSQQTFPDLYRTLGDSNQLPDLTRSDTGMTAYFAVDNIPAGWIAFDSIRTTVTQQNYPELYRHLVGKYGSIAAVPKAEDRFIRNAGNGLQVGQTQEDDLKRHVHRVPIDYDSWFDDSSQGRNNSYFDYTTFTHSSDLWSTLGYDNADGDNGFVSPKDTSQMATGGDETRPKSLVLKLCIKALNSFDDVVFWIKSHGEVTNAGTLDAGRLAQDIQQLSAKTQQIERQSNQNEKLSLELKNQLSQIKNKEPTSRKIWQGNVTNGSGVLTLSESIINKNLVFYLQPSSGHTLSNNDVNTVSCYIDSTLPDVRRTRFAFTAYWDGGLRNFKIEIVSEKQIKLIDASSFYLKMITASD
ncbi:phage tail protein [Haemophilus influenzae]|uniref:phage tail protein n=2 Tax=Haemophilus influenzae TaxID=727 RepID=UPI0010A5E736|nr:phage tail protein [Haemophilus influenzae]